MFILSCLFISFLYQKVTSITFISYQVANLKKIFHISQVFSIFFFFFFSTDNNISLLLQQKKYAPNPKIAYKMGYSFPLFVAFLPIFTQNKTLFSSFYHRCAYLSTTISVFRMGLFSRFSICVLLQATSKKSTF